MPRLRAYRATVTVFSRHTHLAQGIPGKGKCESAADGGVSAGREDGAGVADDRDGEGKGYDGACEEEGEESCVGNGG